MAGKVQLFDVNEDLNEQRYDNLFLVWMVTLMLGGLLFAVAVNVGLSSLHIWVCLGLTVALTYALRHRNHLNSASWVYLLGMTALPIMQVLAYGPIESVPFELILIVIIAKHIRDRQSTINFAVLAFGGTFIAALITSDLAIAATFMAIPAFIAFILAAGNFLDEMGIIDILYWARDIQSKDADRAEMFYEQKVQLSEAMLQLQHANSTLEILNDRLEVAQQRAENASQAKSVFLSNMSHELRTPLNIVIGYTSSMLTVPQMFENVPLPQIYRPYIKLVEENGHYLLGLINDILDLSKIEAGKLELHPAPVELPDLLRGTLSTTIGLLKDKPLQLKPDFPDNLPTVWADPLRVRQIILNLVSNAIKFTHTGSVTLFAHVEGDFVRIGVTDTGIGIPEKALATIFDRFQQAEHDTDKHYGGTGLGLDISKQLSLMHGGDLTVTSVVDQGSTFSFILPLLQPEHVVVEQPFETINDTVHVFDRNDVVVPESQVILLVEDEVSTREAIHTMLETAGYVVIDASDGEGAFELAAGLLPDLIMLDAYLPGMDGWEMLKQLKGNPETATIPVIMVSNTPDTQLAYDLGAELMLQKPVEADDIIACIQTILLPMSQAKEEISE